MFYEGSKKLKNIERAFEIERASYERTICMLRRELADKDDDGAQERYELAKDKVNELLIENENLKVMNENLKKELDQCGKKLNATQYKEYKRLKQAEYTRRWLKKKQAQAKK